MDEFFFKSGGVHRKFTGWRQCDITERTQSPWSPSFPGVMKPQVRGRARAARLNGTAAARSAGTGNKANDVSCN